jgi:hypothetical protein
VSMATNAGRPVSHSSKRMIILSPEVSFGGQCVHVRLHALPVFV